MKDITYFVRERLYPRTWNYIDRIFPEMQFSQVHDQWWSSKYIDGTDPKHVCLWNSSFAPQKSGDQKPELTSFMLRTGMTLGTVGFIYAKLTKNRGEVVGLDATFTYNGNIGVIVPNYNPKQREEQR